MHRSVFHFILKICGNTQRQQINNVIAEFHTCGVKCLHNDIIDLSERKVCRIAVSLNYMKHITSSSVILLLSFNMFISPLCLKIASVHPFRMNTCPLIGRWDHCITIPR